jgi:hypothetical protein
MPVAAHIDPSSRTVIFRCSGRVAIAEARRAFDQMMTDPSSRPESRAMWDFRGALINEHAKAMSEILDMLKNRHPERTGSSRVAILVAREHDMDISTMVTDSASSLLTVRVFSDYVNAARWLGGDDV